MDLISGISAATEGLKLVNQLRKIDHEVDKADLKTKLIDVADNLADAKQALYDAQQNERELRDELRSLNAKLEARGRLEDEEGRLYQLDENGNRFGEPYCNLCFVREDKLHRLKFNNFAGGQGHECFNCEKVFFIGSRGSSGGTVSVAKSTFDPFLDV